MPHYPSVFLLCTSPAEILFNSDHSDLNMDLMKPNPFRQFQENQLQNFYIQTFVKSIV